MRKDWTREMEDMRCKQATMQTSLNDVISFLLAEQVPQKPDPHSPYAPPSPLLISNYFV